MSRIPFTDLPAFIASMRGRSPVITYGKRVRASGLVHVAYCNGQEVMTGNHLPTVTAWVARNFPDAIAA